MDLSDIIHRIVDYLKPEPCSGCLARDYHIASLKEQLHNRDSFIESLKSLIEARETTQDEIIKHITGMNRVITNQPSELKSMPRRTSIQDRIRHAEQVDAASAINLSTQRQKEYNERISAILKPEVEVQDAS